MNGSSYRSPTDQKEIPKDPLLPRSRKNALLSSAPSMESCPLEAEGVIFPDLEADQVDGGGGIQGPC